MKIVHGVYRGVSMSFRWPIIPPGMLMLSSFAGSSVINYLFGLALGWLLIPGDFGLLAFSQTALLIGGLVLNSGFTWSLAAAIVGLSGEQRAIRVRGALAANVLAALALGGLLLLLFSTGPLQDGFESLAITLLVALTLPLIGVVTVARAACQGAERFGWVAALQLTEVGIKAASGVGFALAGYGALGAIGGFTIGSLVAAALGMLINKRVLKVRLFGPLQWPALGAAGSMFGAVIGLALLLNLDLTALKLLSQLDRAQAGHYQAGLLLANTPFFLMTALMPLLFTRASLLGDLAATHTLVGEALQRALLFLIPIELVLAAAPGAVLSLLFPANYAPGADTLRVLALGNCAIIVMLPFTNVFQATHQAHLVARILLLVTAIEALILWVVVPIGHGLGAALVFMSATTVSLLLLASIYALRSRLSWCAIRGVVAWSVRYLAALVLWGSTAAIIYSAGVDPILAALIAGPAYLGVALSFGLLAVPERLRMSAAVRWAARSRRSH